MIDVRKAGSRYTADHGWLKSNFSFSFADYYDPDNMGFGPLRVFNDDSVAPQTGFGSHPHREMEIVSIVLQGQLGHRDSTGRQEVVRPGEVQHRRSLFLFQWAAFSFFISKGSHTMVVVKLERCWMKWKDLFIIQSAGAKPTNINYCSTRKASRTKFNLR